MSRLVLWFRNDLRLLDNAAVVQCANMVQSGQVKEVIPLYCFDPRNYLTTPAGNNKTGSTRAKFVRESVHELKKSLKAIGSDLAVALDRPENVIPGLLPTQGDLTVVAGSEFTDEELRIERQLRRALKGKGQLQIVWDSTLYHKDDLPFSDLDDMPDVFTPFRNKVEAKCEVRAPMPSPKQGQLPLPHNLQGSWLEEKPCSMDDLNALGDGGSAPLQEPQDHPQAALPAKGGEPAALDRLHHYLWGTDAVADYFNTRNGMLGADYSTKFSAWLAQGCISPRVIASEISKYENQRTKNKSTYWVLFELLWRDYFRFFALKHGNVMFHEGGTIGKRVTWSSNDDHLRRWKEGQTGLPLVDANMRELAQTGFMSNRGRQNVASFLVLDLNLDWRLGADWFESRLTDYDVCSNWGNWVHAAGLTGGRVNKFNISKQSRDYDADGDYARAWLPELKNVPAPHIHEPWKMSKEQQNEFGCIIGQNYPEPIRQPRPGGGPGGPSGGGRGRGGRGRGGGRGGRGPRKGQNKAKNNDGWQQA